MERLHFSVHINAPRERVWNILWNDNTYPQWTRPFAEGGRAESDWKEGSRVHFLDAEGEGMYSLIERKEEHAYMGFKHLGTVKDGQELPPDDAMREWAGAREEYTLAERADGTELSVDMDILEGDKQSFGKSFPEALAIVKQLAEQ